MPKKLRQAAGIVDVVKVVLALKVAVDVTVS
jgi:hypothetical protein